MNLNTGQASVCAKVCFAVFWGLVGKYIKPQNLLLLVGSNGPQSFTVEQWGTPDKLPRAHTW